MQDPATDKAVEAWLAEPMTVDHAVRMALLKSPRLQQEYAQLGLARADVLDAIQIANPRLSAAWLPQVGGGGAQTEWGLAAPLADLLVLPTRVRLAHLDYDRARLEIAAAVLDVSLDVRAAWYRAVAAEQIEAMRGAVAGALKTSADLAQRYFDAGNLTELQLSREKAAASKAQIDATEAAVAARMARLDLNLLIGLSGPEARWAPPAALPLPVAQEDDPAELHRLAGQNLALLAAERRVAIARDTAHITRSFRLLGGTSVGYYHEQDVKAAHSTIQGPTLDLELPLFNQGQARVARADAELQIARARLGDLALRRADGIDPAAERVRALSEVVGIYREGLIPARESVTGRSQEEQNFMLIGIFEVIQAKTQEYDAYQGYLEAIRDYWLARVDLARLVGVQLPSESQVTEGGPSAADVLPPAAAASMPGMPGMVMPGAPQAQGSGQ